MDLGAKIKELRQSRGMTQEQVAQKLNVTNQTVSKWETGTACPDLSLIVPIARLFGVTTDTLFDFSATADKLRLEELQKQYDETFKTGNIQDRLEISKQAVKEFPSDMKWLNHYGWDVWCDAIERLKGEEFDKARETAAEVFKSVIEQTDDDEIKCGSIIGICQCLWGVGKKAEALEYVKKFPEINPIMNERQTVYLNCLEGEEQKREKQRYLMELLTHLSVFLVYQYRYDEDFKASTEIAISLYDLFFPGNGFIGDYSFCVLSDLYCRRAKWQTDEEDMKGAEESLKSAFEYAKKAESLKGEYSYDAPLFYLLKEDTSKWFVTGTKTKSEEIKNMLELPYFAKVKALDTYKELFENK